VSMMSDATKPTKTSSISATLDIVIYLLYARPKHQYQPMAILPVGSMYAQPSYM